MHSVQRCSGCKLEFVQPFLVSEDLPNSAPTAEAYLAALSTHHSILRELSRFRAAKRLGLYTELLGGRQPRRVLEVGCGSGWMVWALTELGIEAQGIEIDTGLVQIAKNLGAQVTQADICNVGRRQFEGFDVVCSSQVVEHLFKPRQAMLAMASALREGGGNSC